MTAARRQDFAEDDVQAHRAGKEKIAQDQLPAALAVERHGVCFGLHGREQRGAVRQPGQQPVVELPADAQTLVRGQHGQFGQLERAEQPAVLLSGAHAARHLIVPPLARQAGEPVGETHQRTVLTGARHNAAKTLASAVAVKAVGKGQHFRLAAQVGRFGKSRRVNADDFPAQQRRRTRR